ncbi:SAM-dependent methyltransferase, partial [Saccharopolyspora shandongensis]|uniref:SAM-dependent methyltransferase n=1 Tax=Saccharopolyspora shandongensis TaxID=418495 RepID=UPI0033DF870A
FHDANLGSGFWRTREEIQPYFDGLEMVEPGLAYLHDWWPDGPRLRPVTDAEPLIVGGVGRKP